MPTATISADSGNALVTSVSTSNYTAALDGTETVVVSTGAQIGQRDTASAVWNCWEVFLVFDTSTLPPGIIVTSVDLKLFVTSDLSATDFIMQARAHSFALPISASDWRDSIDTPGDTPLLATLSTSGISAGEITLNQEADFPSYINLQGDTPLYLISSRQVSGTAPTPSVNEDVVFNSPDEANPPQLVINYVKNNHMMNMGAIA